ncbi:hypothetical protein D3C81_1576890 [compost metagenome]
MTILRILRTAGSNRPESIIRPKYRMANISITPVGASLVMPCNIIGPISPEKPPNRANRIGTRIRAIKADRRLVMIRYMKVMTMAKPRKVSMGVLQAYRVEKERVGRISARSAAHGVAEGMLQGGGCKQASESPLLLLIGPGAVQGVRCPG